MSIYSVCLFTLPDGNYQEAKDNRHAYTRMHAGTNISCPLHSCCLSHSLPSPLLSFYPCLPCLFHSFSFSFLSCLFQLLSSSNFQKQYLTLSAHTNPFYSNWPVSSVNKPQWGKYMPSISNRQTVILNVNFIQIMRGNGVIQRLHGVCGNNIVS